MPPFAKLMNNMALFYVVVFIPLALLITIQIKDIIEERKEAKTERREQEDDDKDDIKNLNLNLKLELCFYYF